MSLFSERRACIADVAESIYDGQFVLLDGDGFVEPVDLEELPADAHALASHLDDAGSTLRLAWAGEDFTMVAMWRGADLLAESWALPEGSCTVRGEHMPTSLAEGFPSLRGAPGVRPFDLRELASWAITADAQARGAAAFVIDYAGLARAGFTEVMALWEVLPGGLSHHLAEVFDDDHRRVARLWREARRRTAASVTTSWNEPPSVRPRAAEVEIEVVRLSRRTPRRTAEAVATA